MPLLLPCHALCMRSSAIDNSHFIWTIDIFTVVFLVATCKITDNIQQLLSKALLCVQNNEMTGRRSGSQQIRQQLEECHVLYLGQPVSELHGHIYTSYHQNMETVVSAACSYSYSKSQQVTACPNFHSASEFKVWPCLVIG